MGSIAVRPASSSSSDSLNSGRMRPLGFRDLMGVKTVFALLPSTARISSGFETTIDYKSHLPEDSSLGGGGGGVEARPTVSIL